MIVIFFPFSIIYFLYKIIQYNLSHSEGIALVMIVKNEACYLDEIIQYYRYIKISSIYIFDNESDDNIVDVVNKYDYVHYELIKGEARQRDVYNIFLNKYGYKYKYTCFFDADEFLRVDNDNILKTIDNFFNSQKKIGGIGVSMLLFGSSNHKKTPKGLVIKNYLYRFPDGSSQNGMTKCIVKNKYVLSIPTPHFCYFICKYSLIGPNNEMVSPLFDNPQFINKLAIYHYYSKSYEEYYKKKNKGCVYNGKTGRPFWDLEQLDAGATFYDDYMLKYIGVICK